MSRSKRTLNPATKTAIGKAPTSAPLTKKQQAIGIALAGGSLSTPLLLALLDKVLTLDEIQSICSRAREIARNFDDLPEGQFALACLEDFLLARTQIGRATDAPAPALVPSDLQEASEQGASQREASQHGAS